MLRGHDDAVLVGAGAEDGALEPLPAASPPDGVADGAAGLEPAVPPLLRKSVTYHPDPFSWKPAAVTCLA